MPTKNDIRIVVERFFTMAAGGPVNTSEKISSKYQNVVKKVEETYDVELKKDKLSVDQIVDICYNTNRARAIKKIKRLIDEYNVDAHEVFTSNDEGSSIH